jgi:antirestriction protein ArdC
MIGAIDRFFCKLEGKKQKAKTTDNQQKPKKQSAAQNRFINDLVNNKPGVNALLKSAKNKSLGSTIYHLFVSKKLDAKGLSGLDGWKDDKEKFKIDLLNDIKTFLFAKWEKPWKPSLIFNAKGEIIAGFRNMSGRVYKESGNVIGLERNKGISPFFITLKKLAADEGTITDKQKTTSILSYVPIADEANPEKVKFMLPKFHQVINVDYTEGIKKPKFKTEEFKGLELNQYVENFIKLLVILKRVPKLHYDQADRAYYTHNMLSWKDDRIHLVPINNFKNIEGYYSTLFHEIVHSTMNPERCGRGKNGNTIKLDYPNEELVAEMGAMIICSELGLNYNRQNSLTYLKGWLSKAGTDKDKAMIEAYAYACDAAEYLMKNINFEKLVPKSMADRVKNSEPTPEPENPKGKAKKSTLKAHATVKGRTAKKVKKKDKAEPAKPESNYYLINEDRKVEMYFDVETYKGLPDDKKREIKRYFLWSRTKKAWISKAKNNHFTQQYPKSYELTYWGKKQLRSFEDELQRKKDNAERNIDKYETRSLKAKKRSIELQSEFNRLRKDWSWLTQPIIKGHSGSERFGRSKARVMAKYEEGFKEADKALYYEQKKRYAEEVIKDKNLRNIKFIENRIKDAETGIRKLSKWIPEYQKESEKPEISDEKREKLNEAIDEGLQRLKYNYDKLAYYTLAKSNLQTTANNERLTVFSKDTVKELAKFLKKQIPTMWGDKVGVTASSSFITVRNGSGLSRQFRKSVALFVYPNDAERFEHPNFSIGNIMPTYISLYPREWYKYMKENGYDFNGDEPTPEPEKPKGKAKKTTLKKHATTKGKTAKKFNKKPTPKQEQPKAIKPYRIDWSGKNQSYYVYFNAIPSEAIRERLKKAGFRWNATARAWTIKDNSSNEEGYLLKQIESLFEELYPTPKKEVVKQRPQPKFKAGDWVTFKMSGKQYTDTIKSVAWEKQELLNIATEGYYYHLVNNPNLVVAENDLTLKQSKEKDLFDSFDSPVKIENVKTSLIHTDPKRFQNRKNDFSEDSKNRIVNAYKNGTFDWSKFDPITIWLDFRSANWYVLSGHSRLAAIKEIDPISKRGEDFTRIPARKFTGTEAEAIDFALNSNTLSTKETEVERALYYANKRQMCEVKKDLGAKTDCEKQVENEVRENEGKNANYILNLSYLNPKGWLMDSLTATGIEKDNDSTNVLRNIANWIGEARRFNPELTNTHETEIAKFLVNGGYGNKTGQFKNKAQFNERLNYSFSKWKTAGSDASKPLNLANTLSKTAFETEFDERLHKAKKLLDEAILEHEEKHKKYLYAVMDGTINQAKMDDLMKPILAQVERYKKDYERIKGQKDEVKKAASAQTSLFGTKARKNEYYTEINGEIRLVEKLDNGMIAWNDFIKGYCRGIRSHSELFKTKKEAANYFKTSKTLKGIENTFGLSKLGTGKKPKTYKLKGDLGEFLGEYDRLHYSIVLRGEKGAGKSRLLFQLINAFAAQPLKVAFLSLEMHPNSSVSARYRDEYISPANFKQIDVTDQALTYDELNKLCKMVDVVAIDSWTKLKGMEQTDFDRLQKENPETIILAVFQSTTGKVTRGGNMPEFDAGTVIQVNKGGMAECEKNRYTATDKIFSVFDKCLVEIDTLEE